MPIGEDTLKRYPLQVGQRVELADDVEPGLFVRIRLGTRGRTGSFIWRRESASRRHYEKLGPWVPGTFGLAEARARAKVLNARLVLGQVEATKKSRVPTVREAWDGFREYKLAKKTLRPNTRQFYEFASKHFLDAYDFVKINKLSASDCDSLHTKLGRTAGHRTANAVLDLLGRVWEWAADRGYCGDRRNPTSVVERFQIEKRTFNYEEAEVRRFFKAVAKDPLKDVWLMLAFTGARIGNVLSAHRDQFDLKGRTWTIPPAMAKGKRPIVIQLVDEVVEIVERRGDGWLYPAKRSASGHRTNVAKDWQRLQEAARLPHWRMHTVRKLFATVARNFAGADKGLTSDLLGHVHIDSQSAYVSSTPEAVRKAMEATVAEMRRVAR